MKYTKLILAFAIVAVLATAIASALSFSITPGTAYDNDNLYCSADSNPSAFIFKWFNDTGYIKTGQNLEASYTSIGETLTCRIFLPPTPRTSEIAIGEISRTISPNPPAANNPPTMPTLTLNPGAPYSKTSFITMNAVSTDADNDPITYEYMWQISGNTVSNSNTLNCTGICNRWDIVTAFARAYDGKDYSGWRGNAFSITGLPGFSTVIDSTINGVFYAGDNDYDTISGVNSSFINASTIAGPTISLYLSNVKDSTVVDSTISESNVLDSSTVVSSIVTNSTIDPSTVIGSIVSDSIITNAFLNGANSTNSQVTGSNVFNTAIADAVITNNVISAGTIVMSNGTVYNASANGALNLNELINLAPQVSITSPSNGASFLNGTAINFAATATDANIGTVLNDSLTYLWNFGDGTNATSLNATHSYTSAGIYTVTFTATDKFAASNSATRTLTINPTPITPPFAYCSINSIASPVEITEIKNSNDLDGKEFEPMDNFKVKVAVRNNAADSKTVVVKAVIVYNNSIVSDTEEKISVKISSDSSKTVELNMTIPLDLREGSYQLYVKAYDDDKNSNCEQNIIPFTVTRDADPWLVIIDSGFSPSTAICGDLVTFSGKVANIGTVDEEKVKISYSDDLKNAFENIISNLDWGTESTAFSYNINLPKNSTASSHKISIKLSYDYDSDDNSYGKTKTYTYVLPTNCNAKTNPVANVTVTSTSSDNTSGFSFSDWFNANWKNMLLIVELLIVVIVVLTILARFRII